MQRIEAEIEAIAAPASRLGESPLWHPAEQKLYWCDIPAHRLNRFDPASGQHDSWDLGDDAACCAPLLEGGMLVALRGGLERFDPDTGKCRRIIKAPYDISVERFNDGKADPRGRMWIGTLWEPRDAPKAQLYVYDRGELQPRAGNATTANGLAWSPDGGTMYWSDTRAHTVYAFDFDPATGDLGNRRVFARFAPKVDGASESSYGGRPDLGTGGRYGGRPDGAAVDGEGAYWCAMYEGSRLVRIAPDGTPLAELPLPVRCPTMPCFGDADLKTLYITTAADGRPADELAAQPLAGRVLRLRVEVAGLVANYARL